jgi:hypothetical protein
MKLCNPARDGLLTLPVSVNIRESREDCNDG